jgi:hypothetical protein
MTLIKLTQQPSQKNFNNVMDDLFERHPSKLKADVDKSKSLSSRYTAPVNIKKQRLDTRLKLLLLVFKKRILRFSWSKKH